MPNLPVRRIAATAGATALLAGTLVAGATAPSQAQPGNCTASTNILRNHAISYCDSGTGVHRAVALCYGGEWVWGPWRNPGYESRAACDKFGKPPHHLFVKGYSYEVQ